MKYSEVESGPRFEFGANWAAFLSTIDRPHIDKAVGSLRTFLATDSLEEKSFLDIGSGSGLFSLAAYELGARVHSFDFDPESVECTRELRRRYADSNDERWKIERGSVLDEEFLGRMGTFDIVYSWGVLHHTGALWTACDNAAQRVARNGQLFIAIYNDQGLPSRAWNVVKRTYNTLPRALRFLVLWPAAIRLWGPTMVKDVLRGRPFGTWRTYADENRGMHPWRDVVDWVGGYPFEVATPQQVIDFFAQRGFSFERGADCGRGRGCNQFVFRKQAATGLAPVV